MFLVGMMVTLAGCQEPFNAKNGNGLQIKISAMSNNVETKTSYSGEVKNGRERIDWVAGDKIRIFSEDVDLVACANGMNGNSYNYVMDNGQKRDYYDYTIAANGTPREGSEYMSDSSLKNDGEGVGLVWVNDPTGTASVYGIYPTGTNTRTSDGRLWGYRDLSVSATSGFTWSDKTEDNKTVKTGVPSTDYMKSAVMVAAPEKFRKDEDTGNPSVELKFYPIFNAFEVQLEGENEDLVTIKSLSLHSGVSQLTGKYAYYYRNKSDAQNTHWNNGPVIGGVDYNSGTGTQDTIVSVTFPNETVISNEKAVKATLLTLPPADGHPLTNLILTVTYGSNNTKKHLALKKNNAFIQFPVFQKARLKARMKGDEWLIFFEVSVDNWVPLDTISLNI